jgi:hypothetical protein
MSNGHIGVTYWGFLQLFLPPAWNSLWRPEASAPCPWLMLKSCGPGRGSATCSLVSSGTGHCPQSDRIPGDCASAETPTQSSRHFWSPQADFQQDGITLLRNSDLHSFHVTGAWCPFHTWAWALRSSSHPTSSTVSCPF